MLKVVFFLGETAGGADFFFVELDDGGVGELVVVFSTCCLIGLFFSLSEPLRLALPDVVFFVLLFGEGETDDEFLDTFSLVCGLFTDDDSGDDGVVFRVVSDFV